MPTTCIQCWITCQVTTSHRGALPWFLCVLFKKISHVYFQSALLKATDHLLWAYIELHVQCFYAPRFEISPDTNIYG